MGLGISADVVSWKMIQHLNNLVVVRGACVFNFLFSLETNLYRSIIRTKNSYCKISVLGLVLHFI